MALDTWTFQNAPFSGFPIGNQTYRELTKPTESGNASFTESDGNATRVCLVDWSQNVPFITDALGYATLGPGLTGMNRVLPDLHPEFPLYAMTASRKAVEPSTVVQGVSEWSAASIDLNYRSVDYFVVDDRFFETNELYRFVSRRTIPKGDYLQLATNTFKWYSRQFLPGQNTALGATPGIIVPAKTLEYTWHMIPASQAVLGDFNAPLRPPTEAKILALLGKANSVVFDEIYAFGTVLFTAAEATLIPPRFNNLYHWKIKYYFEVKDHADISPHVPMNLGIARAGVNFLFDPVNNWWDIIQVPPLGAGARTLYQYGDLNGLFNLV